MDKKVQRKIKLVAVGGTALTLLGKKTSTMDIDFTGPSRDLQEFIRAHLTLGHGYDIHLFNDGQIVSQSLPQNYLKKCSSISTNLTKINLLALHPLDIVLAKIGRLNLRDIQDIEICIKHYNLTETQIRRRGSRVGYAGNEKVYSMNMERVIKEFCK